MIKVGLHIELSRSRRRVLHWIVAAAFFMLLITGLILYTPAFSTLASGGWTRLVHRLAAATLVGVPLVYALFNLEAARRWVAEAMIWRKTVATTSQTVSSWRRKHKLLISVGYIAFASTGLIQWFLKGTVSSDVFNISLFIHGILFFCAIVVLLYHVYFEFYWWLWKRKYCRGCGFAYCAEACPVHAIGVNQYSAIERDLERCNNCRLCMQYCQRNLCYRSSLPREEATQPCR